MEAIRHVPDAARAAHIAEAMRVLELPLDANGLHWHPFGVYTMPLAKRTDDAGQTWSRRLHVWHPAGKPVGEASAYGVHTHSGLARSHVLVGTLHHHLYSFAPADDGIWQRACLGAPEGRARLLGHVWSPTEAGTTHELPANQPHGVTKPDGFAISFFEQLDGPAEQEFTTWQRTDVAPEELVRRGPVPLRQVQSEALAMLEAAPPISEVPAW